MEQRRSACDSCRRRRVRCNGAQPCAACLRSGISCTFGSVFSRQSATSYARSLEEQVAELQRQLHAFTVPASSASSNITHRPQQQLIDEIVKPGDDLVLAQAQGIKFFPSSAALKVLRAIADMLTADSEGKDMVEAFETPANLPPSAPLHMLETLLPARDELWTRLVRALDTALIFHDCIDRSVFRARVESIQQPAADEESARQRRSLLAVVYALLALAELYNESASDSPSTQPPGLHYFRASRCIVSEEHPRIDLDSVRAMMFHARYMLLISTFSGAHAALSLAISAAMQMGLHLDDSHLRGSFTKAELYNRRRVFAVLNMMDTYLAFQLGMPRALSHAHPMQTLGLSDEDLHNEGASLIAKDATTPEAETVIDQQLTKIHAKILAHRSGQPLEYDQTMDWVAAIETELGDLERTLPELSNMSAHQCALKNQLTLRLHITAGRMLLYAPFLHHLARHRRPTASSSSWP